MTEIDNSWPYQGKLLIAGVNSFWCTVDKCVFWVNSLSCAFVVVVVVVTEEMLGHRLRYLILQQLYSSCVYMITRILKYYTEFETVEHNWTLLFKN